MSLLSSSSDNSGATSGLRVSKGSAVWDDPHFQLAAEHFGYVPHAPIAERDREVIALADFLRSKIGEWTVRAEDFDRLATAASALRSACKDRLPPGIYWLLEPELDRVDAVLLLNDRDEPRSPEQPLSPER